MCSVHNGMTIVLEIFSMNTADSIVTAINIPQIIECSSPSPATLEILFCLFRTWSFTRFTNDLDSTDNSNSVTTFPMTKFWGLATSWELILSGRPDLSRSVSPFLTDCAVPSRKISSGSGRTFLTILWEVLSGRPDRSYVVVSVFHSWVDQARSSPRIAHGSDDQRLQINQCLYQFAPICLLQQLISMDLDFRSVSSPGLLKLKTTRPKAFSLLNSS